MTTANTLTLYTTPILMRQYVLTYPLLEVATLLVTILACIMVPTASRDLAVRPPPPREMRVSSQALADVRHLLVTTENPEGANSGKKLSNTAGWLAGTTLLTCSTYTSGLPLTRFFFTRHENVYTRI